MELSVQSIQTGKSAKSAKITVADGAYAQPFNQGLVHQVITSYQTCGRAGTRATKGRSDVSGGGKKPFRQKGTGRARAGTIRSPIWRGGGHTFAKTPYDYSKAKKVNTKVYRRAIACILSQHLREGTLHVVDEIAVKSTKTKDFIKMVGSYPLNKTLFVKDELDEDLYLASRNIPDLLVVGFTDVNPVILFQAKALIITKLVAERYSEMLA